MSDTNGHAVDADGDPLFPDEVPAPQFPLETATISAVSPEGFPVTWTLNDPIPGAVSKRIQAVLKLGYTPPTSAPAARGAPAGDGGVPVCPNRNCSRHGEPMEPSQHGTGYYCKGKDTTTGNAKGYCKAVQQ